MKIDVGTCFEFDEFTVFHKTVEGCAFVYCFLTVEKDVVFFDGEFQAPGLELMKLYFIVPKDTEPKLLINTKLKVVIIHEKGIWVQPEKPFKKD